MSGRLGRSCQTLRKTAHHASEQHMHQASSARHQRDDCTRPLDVRSLDGVRARAGTSGFRRCAPGRISYGSDVDVGSVRANGLAAEQSVAMVMRRFSCRDLLAHHERRSTETTNATGAVVFWFDLPFRSGDERSSPGLPQCGVGQQAVDDSRGSPGDHSDAEGAGISQFDQFDTVRR